MTRDQIRMSHRLRRKRRVAEVARLPNDSAWLPWRIAGCRRDVYLAVERVRERRLRDIPDQDAVRALRCALRDYREAMAYRFSAERIELARVSRLLQSAGRLG